VSRALTLAWRLLRAAAGTAITAALLAGLPFGLARFTGSPLPRHWPGWQQVQAFLASPLSDGAIIKALACAVWLLWGVFAVSLLIEVVAVICGRPAPRLPGIAPVQALAAALVGATVMTAFTPSQAVPQTAASLRTALTSQTVVSAPLRPSEINATSGQDGTPPLAVLLDAAGSAHSAAQAPPARPKVHRVVEGDNLWDLAVRYLGHGESWHEIYDLNEGRPQPDGQKLTDPNFIETGWVLLIPPGPGHAAGAPPVTHPRHARRVPEPRHSAPPAPHSPSPAPSVPGTSPSRAPSAGARHAAHGHHRPAVELPSGAIIGLSLAAAAGTAVVLARLHRRRWREPSAVPGTAAAEPPLGPALRRVRHAQLADADVPDDDFAPAAEDWRQGDASEPPPRDEAPTETVAAATRDGGDIALDLACAPGIGITGPGAAGTIRAITVSLLAGRTRDQAEVLLCGQDAIGLLTSPGSELPAGVPGLIPLPPVEALGRLEAGILHRHRLLDAAGMDHIDAYRAADPSEPLPAILAVTPADGPDSQRLAAVLALGQRLGITAILTGAWSPGANCEIAADGRVVRASEQLTALEGARAFQLSADEAAEILAALAAADGAAGTPRLADGSLARFPAAPHPQVSAPVESGQPTELSVLGPFRLSAGGQPIAKGMRRKAAELLTYLALYPDGATTQVLLEALWPDTPPERAAPLLHASTTNVRGLLRAATATPESAFIVRVGDHLRIDARMTGCDLWRFQAALAAAARAPGDQERRALLEEAASLWRGDLADGMDSVWMEEHRETLRRDAVDALARLAQLCEQDEPEHALAILERAITVDRYQEPLYRRIMTIQSALDRPDAARRTYQLLQSRLADIEAEPDESTARLLSQILHRRKPARRRPQVGRSPGQEQEMQ